jgi:hypothetical protein
MKECDWDVKSTTPDLAALQLSECLPVRPVGFKQDENFPAPSKSKGMPSNFSTPDSINALWSEIKITFRGENICNAFFLRDDKTFHVFNWWLHCSFDVGVFA